MKQRGFLKTLGVAAGLTALLGSDVLRDVEAAVGNTTGLTLQQAAREESFWSEAQ